MNTTNDNTEFKKDILKRLNKIEGQVNGIKKMIDTEKQCGDILTQIAAVRGATNKVGGLLLERYSKDCVLNSINSGDNEKIVENLVATIQKFLKFVD